MGKHENINSPPSSSVDASIQSTPASQMDATATPRMALAGFDLPAAERPRTERPRSEMHKAETPRQETMRFDIPEIGTDKIATAAMQTGKIEFASIEAPHIAPDIEELAAAAADGKATEGGEPPAQARGPYISRFTMLAASLALAAAFGGMVGALTAHGLARPGALPAVSAGRTALDEIQALKENVVQARVELAALKVGLESANRSASAQFTRIGELIERFERVQAEPVAKLNKAIETLDRLSKADAAAQVREVTGSVPGKPGIVEGWVVRDVQRGTALIEGRMGLVEVDQGTVVPGLGRVDAIRKQDGRWVVVTSKGLITTSGR